MHIGYARVSTRDQNTQMQLDALKKAGCEKIYEETASGANDNRLELDRMLSFMREGDVLVVWKLDRLARSLKKLLMTVDQLSERGIGFQSITENIDTTSAGGRLIFHIFGSLAEFERNMIRERTQAGLASAREQGRIGGRPRALSEDDIHIAKVMMKDPNISIKQIAQRFNVSRETIFRHVGRKCDVGGDDSIL